MKNTSVHPTNKLAIWLILAALGALLIFNLVSGAVFNKYQVFFNNYVKANGQFLEEFLQAQGQYGVEVYFTEDAPVPARAIVVSVETEDDREEAALGEFKADRNLTRHLPYALRAKDPAEINVIVLVNNTNILTGSYTDGQPAYRRKMEVVMVNISDNTVFARNAFKGGDPPTGKQSSAPGYGSSPRARAFKWIRDTLKNR